MESNWTWTTEMGNSFHDTSSLCHTSSTVLAGKGKGLVSQQSMTRYFQWVIDIETGQITALPSAGSTPVSSFVVWDSRIANSLNAALSREAESQPHNMSVLEYVSHGRACSFFMSFSRAEVDMPLCRFRRQYEQLSQFERGRIIGMMEAGWSARRVARQLGHSDCVVRRC
ncbi:transposable element Tcb2 transposase [Trichonephila clavipes]|nr:transposable element Tcb2 transposase [Trichonephila clavipes]